MPFTTCPMCGYKEAPTYQRQPSQMNHYIDKDNPTAPAVVHNDDRPEFTAEAKIGDKVVKKNWIRKDVHEAAEAKAKEAKKAKEAEEAAKTKTATEKKA